MQKWAIKSTMICLRFHYHWLTGGPRVAKQKLGSCHLLLSSQSDLPSRRRLDTTRCSYTGPRGPTLMRLHGAKAFFTHSLHLTEPSDHPHPSASPPKALEKQLITHCMHLAVVARQCPQQAGARGRNPTRRKGGGEGEERKKQRQL